IYASTKEGERWTKAVIPPNFPQIENEHFCNGTLSPDGKRFYFTICKSTETWGGLTTRCEINVIKKSGSSWSAPEPLSDYVNLPNATSTHPHVIYNGNTEILYFASNRPGGMGGMDIWFITRDIGESGVDFSFPTNCGKVINTAGDEITPFYDLEHATLYFASNGHINIGGYDIFKAMGSKAQWQIPTHLGKPINSSADDYFYVLSPSGATGFLVSNRIAEPRKPTTTHEDIFSFAPKGSAGQRFLVSGRIYDKYTGAILPDVTVAVFELNPDQSKTLKDYQVFATGSYEFQLEPNKQYEIEAQKEGFRRSGFTFNTLNPSSTEGVGRAILLEDLSYRPNEENPSTTPPVTNTPPPTPDPTPDPIVEDPVDPDPVVDPPVETDPEPTAGQPYTTRAKARNDKAEYITSAPRHQGVYYKVQIAAVSNYDENDSRYSQVQTYGRIDTEYLIERKLTRLLIADFFSLNEAKDAMGKARKAGFSSAYLVKYEDGFRMGRISN
ncbi:MAG: PD40 domain-containing protein, partial [Phaeodactylibacter sp.]|nr:PD40 domain-containing protein [Phaeodactylibacter sp.]